jgi:hypothetical protein
MGQDYAHISLVSKEDDLYLAYVKVADAHKGTKEQETLIDKVNGEEIYLRVTVGKGAQCQFSYSQNGKRFKKVGSSFKAQPGRWIGAKAGLFATRQNQINDAGYADYDLFRITP